jgi:transcriptional regulator with XRE-family HTH domain
MAGNLRNTSYKNIFILLKRRGISQTDLAAAIETTPSIISDWKTGRKNPSISLLIKTADYFGVSVDFLLGRTHEENQTEQSDSELAQSLSAILSEAENFADEAVERYGAADRYNPMCTSLKAGILQLIETLNS